MERFFMSRPGLSGIGRWIHIGVLIVIVSIWSSLVLIPWIYEGPKRLILRQKFNRNGYRIK